VDVDGVALGQQPAVGPPKEAPRGFRIAMEKRVEQLLEQDVLIMAFIPIVPVRCFSQRL
jgi:hypothetical protein